MSIRVTHEPLPVRTLQFGEIVDHTFILFLDLWRPIAKLALIIMVPPIAVSVVMTFYLERLGHNPVVTFTPMPQQAPFPMADPYLFGMIIVLGLIQFILFMVFYPMFTTAVTYLAGLKYLREEFDLGSILQQSLRLLPFVLVVFVLYVVLLYIGFFALIIPGFLVLIGFFTCLPALVFERCGPIGALHRSWYLVKGERLRVFALLFVLAPLTAAVSPWAVLIPSATVQAILNMGWSIVYWALYTILPTVYYFHARCRKEHLDLDITVRQMEAALPEPQGEAL